MKIFRKFMRWLERGLLRGSYELVGDEVIPGGQPDQRIRVQDVRSWQLVYWGTGVWEIKIQTADGQASKWEDTHGDFLAIMRRMSADKEEPPVFF
jgi:hypothetical protein